MAVGDPPGVSGGLGGRGCVPMLSRAVFDPLLSPGHPQCPCAHSRQCVWGCRTGCWHPWGAPPNPDTLSPHQDPCRNHKTYREVLAKMKPPLIPFLPLILKGEGGHGGCLHPTVGWGPTAAPQPPPSPTTCPPDLTFLHEGSKTLLDGLVNVEKLVGASCWGGTWVRTPRVRTRAPTERGLGSPQGAE